MVRFASELATLHFDLRLQDGAVAAHARFVVDHGKPSCNLGFQRQSDLVSGFYTGNWLLFGLTALRMCRKMLSLCGNSLGMICSTWRGSKQGDVAQMPRPPFEAEWNSVFRAWCAAEV